MTRLTRKGVKFEWDDLCEKAFQELKMRLTSIPILIVPEQGQRYTVTVMPLRTDWDVNLQAVILKKNNRTNNPALLVSTQFADSKPENKTKKIKLK